MNFVNFFNLLVTFQSVNSLINHITHSKQIIEIAVKVITNKFVNSASTVIIAQGAQLQENEKIQNDLINEIRCRVGGVVTFRSERIIQRNDNINRNFLIVIDDYKSLT